MLTPYGHAQIVDFSNLSDSVLTSIARNALREFAHDYFARNAGTINGDLARAWAMFGEAQRAQRTQEFTQIAADYAANPLQQIDISVSAVTILSTGSLKAQAPHQALVDFEKVFTSDGHELRRELWTASITFEIHGQPEQGSDVAAANPLGVTITDFRAEKAL